MAVQVMSYMGSRECFLTRGGISLRTMWNQKIFFHVAYEVCETVQLSCVRRQVNRVIRSVAEALGAPFRESVATERDIWLLQSISH